MNPKTEIHGYTWSDVSVDTAVAELPALGHTRVAAAIRRGATCTPYFYQHKNKKTKKDI